MEESNIIEDLVKMSKKVLYKSEQIENFNLFCINYYKKTSHLLDSFNKFLKNYNLKNTKLTQIKNTGQFLLRSKDSKKVYKYLNQKGYKNGLPMLNTKISYYTFKKNKFTLIENWENILKVIENKEAATFILEKSNLTDIQKQQVLKKTKKILKLNKKEEKIIFEKLKELKKKNKKILKMLIESV